MRYALCVMVFCIIPTYNEEKNILKVANDVIDKVDKVVVVNDASSDDTVHTIRKHIISDKLIIINHIINRGQGAALQTGNEYAINNNAQIIVHFDADGQFLAKEIEDLVRPIKEKKADVVLGSRFLEKKSKIPWSKEKIIMPLARLINKIFSINKSLKLTDPQSGFRAIHVNAIQELKIEQDRMAHCSEILNKISINEIKVKEVPITVIYNEFGQKFGGGVKIVKDLILGRLIDS